MKQSDILLSRAEKLRREARCARNEATRLTDTSDQQCLLDVAHDLEGHARELDMRARRRATSLETKPRRLGGHGIAPAS